MPPRRKTALQRQAEKLAAMGIDLSGITLPDEPEPLETDEEIVIEAQGVLLYFDLKGEGFVRQVCPECDREFAYTYSFTMPGMLCSNRCRKVRLERLGIPWNPERTLEKRFESRRELPVVLPPEALRAIEKAQKGRK